ncbi:uncharacterized protein LOC127716368 [Mytilus californianus]|uniref:uncharacterized protein LOC127716368 n=1 Tax=Mytilus californianus TaxID=6549 RepID=UPI00224870DC|nr:uncharacterized protein LOC127716368 [Mytilus californianus]
MVRVLLILKCLMSVGTTTQLSVTTTAIDSMLLADTGVFRSEYKSFLFSVKGCRDAHLKLLSHETEVRQYYQVLIGGWGNSMSMLSIIMDGITNVDSSNSSEMDCDVYKQFWISWDQDVIKVGRGNATGDDVFLLYEDRCSFSIKNIQISGGSDWNLDLAKVDWIMYSTPFIHAPVPTGNGYTVNVYKEMFCYTFDELRSVQMPSKVKCGIECAVELSCSGFLYYNDSKLCEMMSYDAFTYTTTAYYRKQLQI